MKHQRIALVTGATGYTGANLVRALVGDGWAVHAIVRPASRLDLLVDVLPSIQLHTHDASTAGLSAIVEKAGPDVVFHVAAQALAQHVPENVLSLIDNNIAFPTQLVEAMAQHKVKYLINTGTYWQHFDNREHYCPANLYAATKQAFEAILQYYVEAKKITAITLKLFDSYGPHDPRGKLLCLLEQTESSSPPLAMSAGEQLIDLVYIDDVVKAFQMAAERLLAGQAEGAESYAVSSGASVSVKDVVAQYEQAAQRRLPIEWGGRPYRAREVMRPWDKGEPLPGWRPLVALSDGIKRIRNKGQ